MAIVSHLSFWYGTCSSNSGRLVKLVTVVSMFATNWEALDKTWFKSWWQWWTLGKEYNLFRLSHKSKLAGINWEGDSITNATTLLYFTVLLQVSSQQGICSVQFYEGPFLRYTKFFFNPPFTPQLLFHFCLIFIKLCTHKCG